MFPWQQTILHFSAPLILFDEYQVSHDSDQ